MLVFQLLLFGIYLSTTKSEYVYSEQYKYDEHIDEHFLNNKECNDTYNSGDNYYTSIYDGDEFDNSMDRNQVYKSANIVEAGPSIDYHTEMESAFPYPQSEPISDIKIESYSLKDGEPNPHDVEINRSVNAHDGQQILPKYHSESAQILEKHTETIPVQNNSSNTLVVVNYHDGTLPKCPNELTYYETAEQKPFCYLITEPTIFPPKCPYPNNVEYYFLKKNYLADITNMTIWTFARRNNSDEQGNFQWKNYLYFPVVVNDVKMYHTKTRENVMHKNCLVINGSNLVAVNCVETHPGICLYQYENVVSNEYCKKRFNDTCISNDLGSFSKCYCKVETKLQNIPQTGFCSKLAELKDPYQNTLILNYLTIDKPCWIDIERDGNGVFSWISSNEISNYTYWSNTTDLSKPHGALSKSGWTTSDQGSLSCAICEVNVEENSDVILTLKRNKTTKLIDLEITNALNIFERVICFTADGFHFISLTKNTQNHVLQDLWFSNDISEYLWCKTLQLPQFVTTYSNKIISNKICKFCGHEFAVNVQFFEKNDPRITQSHRRACIEIRDVILKDSKLIKILHFKENDGNVQVLCHLITKPSQLSVQEEYDTLSKLLQAKHINYSNLASSEVCLPSVTTSGDKILNWPETKIGVTTIPDKLCLQENGFPVTRTCAGDFISGGYWLPANGSCTDVPLEPTIIFLDELLHTNTTSSADLTKSLVQVTKNTINVTSLTIHLISKLLEKVAIHANNVSVKDVMTTINNIMHFDQSTLKRSQQMLNSTDIILWTLDEILIGTSVDDDGYRTEMSEKLLIQVSDLKKTDKIGIKLQNSPTRGFNSNKIEPLHANASQHELLQDNFELAFLVPQQLHNDIMQCSGSKDSPNIITSVFYDDSLFKEFGKVTGKCDGRVVSVLIPGFNCSFTAPLQVIFKADNTNGTKCASWTYGKNDLSENIHGYWTIDGDPIVIDTYQICEFRHVTHFSLLVLGDTTISEGHKKALDIITAIGSGLSILGLLIVFVTAILFRSYRASNGVVINFSVAMTAQIVLLFIADNLGDNKTLCTIFGATLHYIVLAQFCWMLTVAMLQYQRYVVIFSSPITHIVAKSCAFAWGLPLLPVIIIVSISTDNYGENANGLCYALGNYFTFGVLVPVSIIIILNLMVFLRIMVSIAASSRIQVHQDRNVTSILQLRLAFMLYFLLGLTWGFGLLAAIGGSLVYSYLFCLTATLQGFVLFLFFIALNEKTRLLWANLKYCCIKSTKYDVNRDSSASAMIRRRQTITSDSCTDSTTSEMLHRYNCRSTSEV